MICFNALITHYYVPTVKNNCVSAGVIADNAKLVIGNIWALALEKLDFRFICMLPHFYVFI